jgi:transcriptional regulator with XRE-family HTH domain
MAIEADRLRERRKQLGLSQEELAARLQVDQKQISKWENGRGNPTAQTLINLARALAVNIDWLLGLTDARDQALTSTDLDELEQQAIAILRSKPLERRHELLEILRLSAK